MTQQYRHAAHTLAVLLSVLLLTPGVLQAQDGVPTAPPSKFSVGGYGEAHANFVNGPGKNQFDFHRFVIYMGYQFADWIQLNSETEMEHAFVNDGDGEISLEQLYVDFALSRPLNIRAGRVLTPLGIINQRHEPTTFYGVERPQVDVVIIPTTWASDGIGIYGYLASNLSYEAYLVNGLDGSRFSALNGIRGGRIKERPSLNQPAVTGRVDYRPLAGGTTGIPQDLRLGAGIFAGGLNNGNRGADPGLDASLVALAADAQYSIGPLDFRGVYAEDRVRGAANIGNNVASKMRGYYVEGGWHFWPERFKQGKLAESDAVIFARYEEYDTQAEMPAGVAPNPAGDRREITVGLSFYPVPNLVTKADYQSRKDGAGKRTHLTNFGIGWMF